MNNGFLASVVLLSLVSGAAWLTSSDGSAGAVAAPPRPLPATQSREGGSSVPCAVPLRWRVTRVDDGFELSEARAARLIDEAAELWNQASGLTLFAQDRVEGFPVRLVFDERQAQSLERAGREGELQAAEDRLDVERAALAVRARALLETQDGYEARARVYERALREHNDTVRGWNGRGGAPEEVAKQLEARTRALQSQRAALEDERRSLERESDELQRDQGRFNQRIDEQRRRSEALARSFAPTPVQAGEYRETVSRRNGSLVSVSREIQIYRFADDDELRLVAAHELGHALGLGHSPVARAVMAEQHTRDGTMASVRAIDADDVERLRSLCPELVPAG